MSSSPLESRLFYDSLKLKKVMLLLLQFAMFFPSRQADRATFSLPSYCPTSCGNISITYPFGIGEGCFRSGLDLDCDNSTNPPKLFLAHTSVEVVGIDILNTLVYISPQIVTMSPTTSFYKGTLMDLHNPSYKLSWNQVPNGYGNTLNELFVMGCSAVAYSVDLNKNAIIGSCTTLCPAEQLYISQDEKNYYRSCNGLGCCIMAYYFSNETSIGIQLSRINQTEIEMKQATNITAFILDPQKRNSIDPLGINGSINAHATLGWHITDQTYCELAMKNKTTYACLSSNSFCVDSEDALGYTCRCSSGFQGNPYLPNSCTGPPVTPFPLKQCTRNCGEIDVPFPFGLEEGCYRDETFSLSCNRTSKGISLFMSREVDDYLLPFEEWYRVVNISVEEGKIHLMSAITYTESSATIFTIPTTTDSELRNRFMKIHQNDSYSWVVDYISCEDAEQNQTSYACKSDQSYCENVNATHHSQLGYRCRCSKGFEGNPYLTNGCTDIDECKYPDQFLCYGSCTNTVGSYDCKSDKKKNYTSVYIGSVVSISILFMSVVCLYFGYQKRRLIRMKQKLFEQNGGLLIQQLMRSHKIATCRIYSIEEVEKATSNFDSNRVLGSGGQGTVYKGILEDNKTVAIKKAKLLNESLTREFAKELLILSMINHKNVVKLLGCCLEVEIPMLIYEYVPNGTLFHHIHSIKRFPFSLDMRLKIAAESAEALAYLHSSALPPILHGDVKSANILLDDNFTAKVSDFGASRVAPNDETELATLVQGTCGYLDPEYMITCRLTDKSDVYSFGVVLLELLTRRRALYFDGPEDERCLASVFTSAISQNRLLDLFDVQVVNEGGMDFLEEIAELASQCIRMMGEERPTMKEVAEKLDRLRKFVKQQHPWMENSSEDSESLLSIESTILREDTSYFTA